MTRLWTVAEGSGAREVLVVSGHSAPVDRVRFHPSQDTLLCTAASDGTVRLFDVRSATQQTLGKIDTNASDIYWNRASGSHLLAVTEHNGPVAIYDTRKLPIATSSSTAKSSKQNTAALKSFSLNPNVVEGCIFSPSGHHLVAATTTKDGLGEVTIWDWEKENSHKYVYPAHTGPVYSLAFSNDGKRLATGGSDAIVGLWDVESMVCTNTISRCTKFTRSVSFSHDSLLIASSSEEDGIDVANAETGDLVGKVFLGRPKGGADEISFHPRTHLLACARCDMGVNSPAVTVARVSVIRQQ